MNHAQDPLNGRRISKILLTLSQGFTSQEVTIRIASIVVVAGVLSTIIMAVLHFWGLG
ncbi:MAG: hypothetical protein ACOYK8_01885 [Alphaproteobacteria bacterium]